MYQFTFLNLYTSVFEFRMWLWFRIWTKILADGRIWRKKGTDRGICIPLFTPLNFEKFGERKNKIYAIGSFLRCGIMWTWNVIGGCYMNLYKQMLFRNLANMLLRLLVWFLLFQTILRILKRFGNFWPFQYFSRYPVSRYFVTRYSLLRYSLVTSLLVTSLLFVNMSVNKFFLEEK